MATPLGGSLGTASSSSLAGDARSIDSLKRTAAQDPKGALKETAKQFEALFMQQLLKSMRQATVTSGLLDNAGTQMGTEMLDAQLSTRISGMSGGLADVIARQLERATTSAGLPAAPKPLAVLDGAKLPTTKAAFVQQHDAAAKAVESQTGIPASFMVAQAAHESGWGKREILNADGSSAHNLFGIKAGAGWNGPVAEITTTEYVDGVARKTTAKFRAYASYEESFRDYAKLIKDNPRYQEAYRQAAAGSHNGAAFAQQLQRAGYATDPAYADKLTRMINTTLQLQRAVT